MVAAVLVVLVAIDTFWTGLLVARHATLQKVVTTTAEVGQGNIDYLADLDERVKHLERVVDHE